MNAVQTYEAHFGFEPREYYVFLGFHDTSVETARIEKRIAIDCFEISRSLGWSGSSSEESSYLLEGRNGSRSSYLHDDFNSEAREQMIEMCGFLIRVSVQEKTHLEAAYIIFIHQ